MRVLIQAAVLAVLCTSAAQAQAPTPGSSGGGGVGASDSTPNDLKGVAPPGTPGGETTGDRALRNAAGQSVIGKTETPPSPVPGDTRAPDAGVRK
jgi:hypothetical protein